MLRDTARGGLCYKGLSFPAKESPCYTNSRYLFILLNSEKNEPRSAAAVIGLLGSSPQSPSGSAELASLDSPRPFSSVFLATSPPDKGGDFASLFTPLALRALPLYSLTETQGERVRVPFCSLQCDTPHTGYGRGRVGVMLNFRLALFPI